MFDSTTDNSTNQRTQKFILSQPKMHKSVMKNVRLLHSSIAIFIFLLASGITKTNAVPTDSAGVRQHAARPLLLHRALRDVATVMTASLVQEDRRDAATSTETTLDQPQGQCLLDGVLISRTSVECKKQVGCRAIQKTGHCCPDYKCDCEKDGKTYSNGYKLVDPETPCTVCYCKGGEIICSSAVCFHRDDCTPRYIPGRCCPEYDNCPVANKTMIATTAAPKPEGPPASALNPNITIKEITKPTEIRITDENKAKPIHQMLKTSTTTTTTTIAPTTSSSSPTSSSTGISTTLIKVSETVQQTEDPIKYANSEHIETVVAPIEFPDNRAESPISQELQRVDNEPGNDSSKVNIKREYMFGTTEGPLNASYTEGNSDLSSAELLFEHTVSDPSEFNGSLLQTDVDIDPETAGSDNIYHIILSTDGPGDIYGSSTDSSTATKLWSTTEGINSESSTETAVSTSERFTTDAPSRTTDSSTEMQEMQKSTDSSITEATLSTTHHHMEEDDTALPMESNPAYPSLPEDDFSIRDVNLPLTEVEDTAEPDIKDEQRSIGIATDKKITPKSTEATMIDSGSGYGADMVASMKDLTENDLYSSTTSSTMESSSIPSAEKIPLMYSFEEASSAETAISNATDFKMEKIMRESIENETGSGDSLEISSSETIIGSDIDGSGNGSGSGMGSAEQLSVRRPQKQREPTTPRPTRKPTTEVDIDELGDASGDGKSEQAEDPKLDAESLKVDEKDNDSIVQTDAAAPKNVISVKVDPTQDKPFDKTLSTAGI